MAHEKTTKTTPDAGGTATLKDCAVRMAHPSSNESIAALCGRRSEWAQ